jgi:hypothetical protein
MPFDKIAKPLLPVAVAISIKSYAPLIALKYISYSRIHASQKLSDI